MTTTAAPELRVLPAPEVRSEGRRLVGYAAIFEAPSNDLGGFTERIARGAFDAVLAAGPDAVLTLNHGDDSVLARTTSGTLRLRTDGRGLAFDADLPDSPMGDNVRQMVRRGDVTGASFRFVVAPGGERWDGNVRTITRVGELLDVSLATRPAYSAARVELRTHTTTAEEAPMDTTAEAPATAEAPDTTPPAATAVADPPAAEPAPAPTLRVEDRSAAPAAAESVEARVRTALRAVRKGENRALTTASTLSPGELSSFLFDKLVPESVALSSGITVVTTERDSVTYPRLTADVAPGWTSEAATITPGDPALDSTTATPRKLAHLVQFSNEVIEDSEPSAVDVVRDSLVRAMGLKLDLGVFEGSGTAPEIRGLRNVAGVGTVSMGATGATPTNLDPWADAIALLEAANTPATAIVMHPRTWATLRKVKESTGSARPVLSDASGSPTQGIRPSIYGVPVFISGQLSITETQGTATNASTSYVYTAREVVLVRRTDIEVELDRSRLFNSDQSEMRGRMRADLIVPNPAAVVRIIGILP